MAPRALEEVDLPELLTRVAGVVWPLFAGVEAGARHVVAAHAVDRALAPLPAQLRFMAGLVLDAGMAVTEGVTLESVLGRMASLGHGATGVMRSALGRGADARWVDALYATLEAQRDALGADEAQGRRFLWAAAIALAGRLPLGLDSAEALLRHDAPALAIAVGDAAKDGDPGARAMLREAVANEGAADALVTALLFGLGEGSFMRGLERLVTLAGRAVIEPPRWAAAALRGTIVIWRATDASRRSDGPQPGASDDQLETLRGALSLVTDADAGVAFLEALPPGVRAPLLSAVRRDFAFYPPAARAAVVRSHLKETLLGAPDAALVPAADFLRERSPPVLLIILDLVQRLGDAIPSELRTALGRAFSDHPDVAVRRALATTIAPRTAPAAEAAGSAEVVALPPEALARDDLDRLRAALWAGESERIVELATYVPLDRRALARESLLASLEIPNAPLRRAIVEAVGRIGSHADGARLLDAARRYRALEGTVAAALRELGARGMADGLAEIYRRRLKWADDDAVDDYCAIAGPEQVMHLMQALETRYYPSARAGAARALARRRAAEGVFALRTAALSDTQETARLAALGALHELTGTGPSGDEIAGHALLFRATEDLPETIERAREAGTAALTGIRRTLARGSWKRRRAACDVLATMPVPEATQVLVEVLEDPDEDVRLAAVEALAQRGWQPGTAREATLQALASRRIRELCERAPPGSVDPATLVLALGFGGHVFRAEVLEALGDFASGGDFAPSAEEAGMIAAARMDVATAVTAPHGLEAVLRAVDHTWQANPHRARFVRDLASLPSQPLALQLETDPQRTGWSWRAREAIAQALERAHDPDALKALGLLVLEDDDDVRRAALQSLSWIGSAEAADEVARGLQSPFQEDRDVVARALGTFAMRGAATIDMLMHDGWWESRQGAALALGHWRSDVQSAVDRLIVLAVDPEYRVAQAAREGLTAHGLLPTIAALCEAVGAAQALTLEGLEPWLGLHRSPGAPPEIADKLDALVEELPADALPQRLGLIATFRAEHLAAWLEDAALGRAYRTHDGSLARHVGVRLAAADTLRALLRRACPVCLGEGTVRCPGCGGAGDVACSACQGRGSVMVKCPDPGCTALGTLRRIDSRRCPTCRGRGEVPAPCACEGGRGRVPCGLCAGGGRLGCSACDGTGNASATDSA